MVESLEKSKQPSKNYMNAVQSLYRDQLEESLADYRRHKGCFSTH